MIECQCDKTGCAAPNHAGKDKCSSMTPAMAFDVNSTAGWFKSDRGGVCPDCGKENGLTEPYPPAVLQ